MVDDVKNITETAESKATADAIDRARLARERREAEQRKRLDELRAHAAAAQAQREKRDEERRRRQAEQRAKDDDRRVQVEERKRAIWEASISRREALLQRERDRTERLERARAARSAPRPAFAFGSSTPRLLEPLDSAGFFWAARRAASTTNVMFASAPLTRRASALQLDTSDTDNKGFRMFASFYEPDRQPAPVMWSSVARRRTDLVPTAPAPRVPGRAYSMTRLDRLPRAEPTLHLSRTRPAGDTCGASAATTPSVSRDGSVVSAPRRPASTPRRPRPASLHAPSHAALSLAPGEGKPPVHRKPKPSKEHDKTPRGKSVSASPGRTLSPSPAASKEPSVDKEIANKKVEGSDKPVDPREVTQKLQALQVTDDAPAPAPLADKVNENKETIEDKQETKPEQMLTEDNPAEAPIETPKPAEAQKQAEAQKPAEVPKPEVKVEEKKENAQEKTDDSEMTASMTARRITTEEEAKAALAERRRRAREELERQAELERQRLQREAEEEAERQRQEEERQRREEEEARELAALQRRMEEEKLRKAIEAQQQLEREESERRAKEEAERKARLKEDEEKRKAAEEAERLRREEAEREEKERLARKQRVEAIMARTRLKKQQEEEKKQQESKTAPAPAPLDNGNAVATGDLLGLPTSQSAEAPQAAEPARNNGNAHADPLGLSRPHDTEDTSQEESAKPVPEASNGNHPARVSAAFIQSELRGEALTKAEDYAAHNGHNAAHPLTLQNAI
ncbi:ensconsin-like isoform X2 [Ostrinia furnacalis]|uniref:ensconsin-like isoform X2 n=1 Tax=Ostrinia furnacalis TaxID=93504 RepID=UPI00103F1651|nr:ensconsin-like isoform X2 [Ostrinia furnacalis]